VGWDLFRSGSRCQETQQANYLRKFPNLGDARLIMCNVSGKVIINFIESFRAFYPDDASAPGLRPHHNLQHRRRPCKSRSQTQVQHYTETTLSPDRYFHGTLSRDQVGSTCPSALFFNHPQESNKYNTRDNKGSLQTRREWFARWEMWYWKHSNTAGIAIHSGTIYFGNSYMLDTPRWVASNSCFAEMGVESSTWPAVCSESFIELHV